MNCDASRPFAVKLLQHQLTVTAKSHIGWPIRRLRLLDPGGCQEAIGDDTPRSEHPERRSCTAEVAMSEIDSRHTQHA